MLEMAVMFIYKSVRTGQIQHDKKTDFLFYLIAHITNIGSATHTFMMKKH